MPGLESMPVQAGQRQIKLLGKQALFAQSKARYPAMFGGFASGKTTAGCIVCLDLCIRFPGIVGAIIRNTYPELRTSTKKVFMDLVTTFDQGKADKDRILESSNEQYNWVKFKNGSVVFFLHTGSEGLFKGPEFGFFFIDQAEELDEEQVKRITTRLRQPGYPQKGMFVGNTDKGHNWCYRWFKLQQKANTELFEISFLDNRANLDEYYVKEMLTYPEEWKIVNLFGSWDAPGGLVIEPTDLHMLADFNVPSKYPKFVAIDPAESTGTTGALGFTVDFEGNYIIYNEYYVKRKIIKEHAAGIRGLWGGDERLIVCDPAAWKKHQVLETDFVTIADRYREHGIPAIPAANNMQASLDIVRELHEPDEEHRHIITGQLGGPRLYFVYKNLPHLFAEMRSWMIEEPDKEPVHLCDCLRYGLLSKEIAAPTRRRGLYFRKNKRTSFMAG